MLNKLPKIFLILFGILITANLLFLDRKMFKNWKLEIGNEKLEQRARSENKGTNNELALDNKIATDSCGLICQKTIAEKIKEELAKIPSPAGQSSVSPVVIKKPTVQPTTNQSRVVYVPLITSGSVSSVSWADVIPSEFYFDLNDYQGAKEIRFQAYILSLNNDLVTARLYDVTNGRGVDFSDIQTASSTFTRVESSSIKIWRGNNKYTVQLRSVNGTQAQLKDAKLKIIF